jgi:hypothetical protein
MLIAILRRYVRNPRWFIILTVGIFTADVLIAAFIGDRLVRWELEYIKESWHGE